MNVLVTGGFQLNSGEREQLEAAGHKVFVHGDERAPVDCPERYEAVVCNGCSSTIPSSALRACGSSSSPARVLTACRWTISGRAASKLHNAAGVYSVPMAEFAVCGILQLYKQSRFFAENQIQHKWEKQSRSAGAFRQAGVHPRLRRCGTRDSRSGLKAFGCHITGVNRTVRVLPDF